MSGENEQGSTVIKRTQTTFHQEKLDVHFCTRTNELFGIQDKIILYDLTNTYFEGEKRNSKLA
jgi:hypothetical protein